VCSACRCDGRWEQRGSAALVTIAQRPGRARITEIGRQGLSRSVAGQAPALPSVDQVQAPSLALLLLPDAGRMPAGRWPDALDPGFHCVGTRRIRGFIVFQLAQCLRTVMLMVPACPESGFLGRAGSTAAR
jgi:hypothetical protein